MVKGKVKEIETNNNNTKSSKNEKILGASLTLESIGWYEDSCSSQEMVTLWNRIKLLEY